MNNLCVNFDHEGTIYLTDMSYEPNDLVSFPCAAWTDKDAMAEVLKALVD